MTPWNTNWEGEANLRDRVSLRTAGEKDGSDGKVFDGDFWIDLLHLLFLFFQNTTATRNVLKV